MINYGIKYKINVYKFEFIKNGVIKVDPAKKQNMSPTKVFYFGSLYKNNAKVKIEKNNYIIIIYLLKLIKFSNSKKIDIIRDCPLSKPLRPA